MPCPLAQTNRQKSVQQETIHPLHPLPDFTITWGWFFFFKGKKKPLNVVFKKKICGLVWSYSTWLTQITVSLEVWQERACGDWGNLAGYVHSKHGINLDLNSWLINQLQNYLLHLTDRAMIFHPNKRKSVPLTNTNSQGKKKHMKEIIGTPDEHYKHYINVNHPWRYLFPPIIISIEHFQFPCTEEVHVKSFCHTGEKKTKSFLNKRDRRFLTSGNGYKKKENSYVAVCTSHVTSLAHETVLAGCF